MSGSSSWASLEVERMVPSREPLLGRLVIPENDPSQAQVECTALGNAVVDELKGIVTGTSFSLS